MEGAIGCFTINFCPWNVYLFHLDTRGAFIVCSVAPCRQIKLTMFDVWFLLIIIMRIKLLWVLEHNSRHWTRAHKHTWLLPYPNSLHPLAPYNTIICFKLQFVFNCMQDRVLVLALRWTKKNTLTSTHTHIISSVQKFIHIIMLALLFEWLSSIADCVAHTHTHARAVSLKYCLKLNSIVAQLVVVVRLLLLLLLLLSLLLLSLYALRSIVARNWLDFV